MFPTADTEDISQVTSLSSKSSPSRDVRNFPECTQEPQPNNNRELTLNMLIKEMVFCIALALTTYGALHNTPTKVSKHPQATRFFSPHSVVTDWYRGQLSKALEYVNKADISFVMYYAPWDAESQHVRHEFDKVASVLNDRVYFAAINCWNPGSECRLQHNKIPSWPILMAYTVNSRGVLYKGPRDAHSMAKFLQLIIKPLNKVASTEELINLLAICDAVAVGYTPLSETSKYYNVWYQVALKVKEFDVVGEVCFAVVTAEDLAEELGVRSLPAARLMLWNTTLEYKVGNGEQRAWNESGLVTWILEEFNQPVARIIPLWRKAFSFEKFVDGNPILMLFTPINPVYQQQPSYDLLREIAMEYYNCKNNQTNKWTMELIKIQQVQRILFQEKNFDSFCHDFEAKSPAKKITKYYKKSVISHNNKYPWSNSTQRGQRNGLFNFLEKRGLAITKLMESTHDNSELLASLGLAEECSTNVLPAEKSFYENQGQCLSLNDDFVYEQDINGYLRSRETTMLPFEDDPLSPENLMEANVKHFCKLLNFAKSWGPLAIPGKVNNSEVKPITGLACAKNFTLNMLAVDSVKNHHFAESLGIDIVNKKDMTAVVILDSKHESQYVLSEAYNAKTVRDFIYNFTHKKLKRSLRTHVEDASHTHYFGSTGITEQMGINESTIIIKDLTTRTFRKFIRTPGKVSLVVVCGGWMGAGAARAVRAAARLLAAVGAPLQAARLDALRHDLPAHYTPHTYPAILVFSDNRGGDVDSRAYPPRARITASGLVALVLRALRMPHHLRVRLALCGTTAAIGDKKTCLRDLKEHVSTVIGRNLKYWRRTDNKQLRDSFLKRLQHLHQVSLQLSLLHITDLKETSEKKISLLNSLTILSKNWDIDVPISGKNVTLSESS